MRLLVIAALVLGPRVADACLWDYDTLKEETLGQEDVGAVIGGDLHKHSRTFYEAKVTYTRTIIDGGKAPQERYDDLAVALAKLGKLDDALAVLADKDTKFPGEYTTEANRGTFLAAKGDIAGALEHLRKAIAINPDAHFGREKFQIQFLDYLGKLAKDPKLAMRESFLAIDTGGDGGFTESRVITGLDREPGKPRRVKVPTPEVTAIVGIIRFGDGQDNPHLWYALGWAFVMQGDAQLAARAFRRADVLGHPRGHADGANTASTIKKLDGICCSKDLNDARTAEPWKKLVKLADDEWAHGQAADARRQHDEDVKIARGQLKAVFGY